MMPDATGVVATRAAPRDDDGEGGTKASADPTIAVDRRKRSAALVVFIFTCFFVFPQTIIQVGLYLPKR